MTGLHVAAQRGLLTMAQVLVDHKADINIRDISGYTPVFNAVYTNIVEMLHYLRRQGADMNIADNMGRTPLHIAASIGLDNIVGILLVTGNLHSITLSGYTPLHLASYHGNTQVVRSLCQSHANVDKQSVDGSTSLSLACRAGYFMCVEVLLQYKADPHISNNSGMTAFDEARNENHTDILDILQQTDGRKKTVSSIEASRSFRAPDTTESKLSSMKKNYCEMVKVI